MQLQFAENDALPSFADVILPLNLPQILTYGVPVHMQELLKPGMRVEVSLGRNKQYSGIVDKLHHHKPEAYNIKPIKSIIDNEPVVNEQQLRLWHWIAHYYMASVGEVMQAALPAHLKLMAETSLVWIAEKDVVYEWSDEAIAAAEALERKKELSLSELKLITGVKHFTKVIDELLQNEAVEIKDNLEPSYKPRTEKVVALHKQYSSEEKMHELFDALQKAPKQLKLLLAYIELSVKNGFVRQQDLLERADATTAQVKALTDKNIFVVEDRETDRLVYKMGEAIKNIHFSKSQQEAYDELNKGLQERNVTLLHGVTGSGKTLLYIHKIKECLAAGEQAVFLLPEIGLTTQLVSRLYAYFGEELGVYHSRFTSNERTEIWNKVAAGKYKVVLGPRSALWLPYQKLGVVVVDEEHDTSYKQKEPAPRFHARDAAIYLAALYDAKVILGSATPSVESLFNVQHHKYAYVQLKERYKGVNMPAIQIVNAQSLETVKAQGIKLLTPELQQAIKETLEQRKQVILFQNRRGYAPFQVCTVCGWVPQCKNCAVSLTYHKSTDKLHCHYCGAQSAVLHSCLACGSTKLRSKSFGTEKIEEEVQQIFPEARVARMDLDSMRGKQSLEELMDLVHKRKVDILVGTQMVVKGLDFPSVSLVGVLSADSLLSFPDFRVHERAFQLMEQVSGRAGRSDGAGKVIIQAYNTEHPVLKWVVAHDVKAFYTHEIKYRQHFGYPPFVRLIKIVVKDKDEAKCIHAAARLAGELQHFEGINVQGPVAGLVPRIRNLYIYEIWIKCPRDIKMLDTLKQTINEQKQIVAAQKGNANLQIYCDADPV